MNTRTIILASFSLLLALPSAWGGPLTPEHAWRQMQGDSNRRVTAPRTRPVYRSPQIKLSRTRSTTKTKTTIVQPKQPAKQPAQKTVKKNGQGWLSRLKSKITNKAPKAKEKAQSTEAAKTARTRKAGRAMVFAKVKLGSIWSGMVGGIKNLIALHNERVAARNVAFNALYWRQPMLVPPGTPIPAEILIGGMRLHKLQGYGQGTLGMMYKSGLVTAAEFRILTQARMGLPQMMPSAPDAPQAAPVATQPEAPTMPPPPPPQQQQ